MSAHAHRGGSSSRGAGASLRIPTLTCVPSSVRPNGLKETSNIFFDAQRRIRCATVHVNRVAGDDNPPILIRLAVGPLAQLPFPLE